jgi:hypothetical protein
MRGVFCLTQERTNGKVDNSLQSEKVVQWTIFENLALSIQQSAFSQRKSLGWAWDDLG